VHSGPRQIEKSGQPLRGRRFCSFLRVIGAEPDTTNANTIVISAGLAGVSTQWQRKAALIEPFLVAKVVLCWIVALPVFALCLFGVTIWDRAALTVGALRRSRYRKRFHLKACERGVGGSTDSTLALCSSVAVPLQDRCPPRRPRMSR